MGIDLGDLVQKQPTSVASLKGQRVAIDAWNILYQFLSSIRQPDGTPLMNQRGEITSHLAGTLYRTATLVEAGVKPVWVFDGEPHVLKQETLAARAARRSAAEGAYAEALEAGDEEAALSKAKQTSRLTAPMAEQAKSLLRSLGVPVIDAPSDGEAQAAWMATEGLVDHAGSQDFDALLYGASSMVRNLTVTGRRKLPGKQVWVNVEPERIDLAASLDALELDRDGLIDVALLVGTDFHPGIKGIGPKKALALVKKNGGLEPIIERLGARPESATSAVERALLEQHEALMDRETIRDIFARPAHVEPESDDLDLSRPDADAVTRLMVKEHGFAQDRVDAALKRYGAAQSQRAQTGLFDF